MSILIQESYDESTIASLFSRHLKEELSSRGRSLDKLSSETGIPASRLSALCSGSTPPSSVELARISLALCCSADYLLGLSSFSIGQELPCAHGRNSGV